MRWPLIEVLSVLVICGALMAVQLLIVTLELLRLRRDVLRALAALSDEWRGVWRVWGQDDVPTIPRASRLLPAVVGAGPLARLRAWWRRVRALLRRIGAAMRE